MTAPRVRLDIDATRDKLAALGCGHAAAALEPLLAEAVRSELAAHLFLDRLLDAMLASTGRAINFVVNIEVDDATIIERLMQRGRSDDREEVIKHRLDVYNAETAPLLDFYGSRGSLVSVHGIGTVDEVNQRILDVLR